MIEENASKLWKIIQEAGDYLMGWRNTLVTLIILRKIWKPLQN